MPATRSPAARRRHSQVSYERRVRRDAARLIVPISNRPLDDGPPDLVAIDMALRHWTKYGAGLRRNELIEAIRIGHDRGIGRPALATLLCLHEREVERLGAQGRAGRQAVAA